MDASEEGIHFDRELHSPRVIGRRAVAAAVSDLAAMGGLPIGSLISLVVPRDRETALEAVAAAGERASELDAPVIGGNLTAGGRLALHVTVVGALAATAVPLRRSGALPGDGLFVSGELGGAALGLEILRRSVTGDFGSLAPEERRLLDIHLDPAPRLPLGRALVGVASAAMDISDGLALDLHRLAAASKVGAVVEVARLPVAFGGPEGLTAALFGGEDYELLVTGPTPRVAAVGARFPVPGLTRIGRITPRVQGGSASQP